MDITIEELFQAYYDCRVHKRNTNNAMLFEINLERNLMDLYYELLAKQYYPGKSMCFVVTHPKPREIWAADFRDRIVHHLLYNRISNDFYKRFSADTCACIPGRGTLYAVNRLTKHLRSATQDWTKEKEILQMDLANFFVSIKKDILEKLLLQYIHNPYTQYLTKLILHHDPTKNVIVRSSDKLMNTIPIHKSLFNANGNGLPIGNLTSQFFANVYLNPLDQFIKRELKEKYYIRYVDDIAIVGNEVRKLIPILSEYVLENLNINFHPHKTHIQSANMGVSFVGYIVRPHARYLKRRIINTAKNRINNPIANRIQSINSYFGMLRQTNGYNHRRNLAKHANKFGIRINKSLTQAII